MDKIKLGIIGIGNMGSGHASNIKSGKCPEIELAAIADMDKVLSLGLVRDVKEQSGEHELKDEIEKMIAERAEAKKAKDFARADAIRDELLARGVAIKDTREGVVWELV